MLRKVNAAQGSAADSKSTFIWTTGEMDHSPGATSKMLTKHFFHLPQQAAMDAAAWTGEAHASHGLRSGTMTGWGVGGWGSGKHPLHPTHPRQSDLDSSMPCLVSFHTGFMQKLPSLWVATCSTYQMVGDFHENARAPKQSQTLGVLLDLQPVHRYGTWTHASPCSSDTMMHVPRMMSTP